MTGLSTTGSISFGWALVAGKRRVPSPATGMIALRIFMCSIIADLRAQGYKNPRTTWGGDQLDLYIHEAMIIPETTSDTR